MRHLFSTTIVVAGNVVAFGMSKRPRRTALMTNPADSIMAHVLAIELGGLLAADSARALKPWKITVPQYNALRVLYVRDPDGEGLPSGSVGGKLVSRVPDVTRLLDRLEKRGLIERFRSDRDRRTVLCRITTEGTKIVEEFHRPMLERNAELFAHMSEKEVRDLAALLERALSGVPRG
jgi:DNA-binding MarR family transcriptional regulator